MAFKGNLIIQDNSSHYAGEEILTTREIVASLISKLNETLERAEKAESVLDEIDKENEELQSLIEEQDTRIKALEKALKQKEKATKDKQYHFKTRREQRIIKDTKVYKRYEYILNEFGKGRKRKDILGQVYLDKKITDKMLTNARKWDRAGRPTAEEIHAIK